METCKHCKKELVIGPIITSYDDNGKWVETRLCPYCKLPLQGWLRGNNNLRCPIFTLPFFWCEDLLNSYCLKTLDLIGN